MAVKQETVKVKLTTARAGHVQKNGRTVGEYVQQVGQEIELPTEEGLRLVDRAQATLVE